MALITGGNYPSQQTKSQLLLPDRISKESLFRLKHRLVFPRMALNTYAHEFNGHMGDTINIKKPFLTQVAKGVEMVTQDIVDLSVSIKVDQRWNYALQYSDRERTMDINDFSRRYLMPGMEELAYQYDIAGANELAHGCSYVHGKPGQALYYEVFGQARAFADEMAIPLNDHNFAVVDPVSASRMDADMLARNNSAGPGQAVNHPGLIAQAVRRRFRGMASFWHIVDSIHIPMLENAAPTGTQTPLANNSSAQSGDSIVTDGWGTTAQKVLNKGQAITFAGVEEVIPRGDRRATGRLKRFTVQEDVNCNASGEATIKIAPEMITADATKAAITGSAGGAAKLKGYQNVSSGVADNAAITIEGDEGKKYRQLLFWERNALQYVNVALHIPDAAREKGYAMDPETGLSISICEDWTISNLKSQKRADIFFGVKTIYPELAIRIISDEVNANYFAS